MNSPLKTGRPLIRMALKDYQSIEEVAFRVSMFWQLQQYRSLVQSSFSLKDSRRELRAMLGSDKRSCVRTQCSNKTDCELNLVDDIVRFLFYLVRPSILI